MKPIHPSVRTVVDKVNLLLAADGGHLTPVEQLGDAVVLRYEPGKSKDCPTCVLNEDAVVALVEESLQLQAPFIRQVRLVGSSEAE